VTNVRFAVDRYKIGIETEVNADEFDGQMYIPARRTRFYCPECGEIVYFRAKGGAHPNQFYHQEKTDQAPECDKRVDDRSELSLKERVGLPLYITRNGFSYELSIGFPALGKDMLSKASEAQYTVEISYGTFSQRISVDHTNFIEDEMTLIPINFLPDWGKNYVITTNGIRAVYGIQRKWSDYADGFDRSGAIFSYSETGGKKIRRGDCISTHRQYNLLTQNRIPDYSEILRSEEGKVSIGSSNFTLYKIEIQVSSDESSRYHRLTDLAEYYGIDGDGAHRAMNDCLMNQKVFELLRNEMENPSIAAKSVKKCPKCGSPLKLRKGKYGDFWGCTGYPDCRYTKNA